MAKNYYQILGVDPDADTAEIKKAFRARARDSHPDSNPGDSSAEHRFREIAEAYEVLSDPERRRRYDRGDSLDLEDLLSHMGGLDDLISSVFGNGGWFGSTRGPTRRGRDILVGVEVGLADAAFGAEAVATFEAMTSCEECGGDGSAPGSARTTCATCGGAGSVRAARRSLFGSMMTITTCPECGGEGSMVNDPCPQCGGAGAMIREREVKVAIPAGVISGTRLRLSGKGESAPRGGLPGDLFVEVTVLPDPRFQRSGDDLIHRATVPMTAAALGTSLEVPLLEGGFEKVVVPAGTQPGATFVLSGLGVPHLGRRGRGDIQVVVDVTVPTSLTVDQEEAMRRLEDALESPEGP